MYTMKSDHISTIGNLNVENCNFMSNNAPVFGAAIRISRHWMNDETDKNGYYYNMMPPNYEIVVKNSLFKKNVVETGDDVIDEQYGGAAFALFIEKKTKSSTRVTIDDCDFIENMF